MYNRRGYPRKDSAPPHIKALREKLCADFITYGECDPDTLTALIVYVKSVRGKRPDGRKVKSYDTGVRPIIDSGAISPKYAAYIKRQRAIHDRNDCSGLDEPST